MSASVGEREERETETQPRSAGFGGLRYGNPPSALKPNRWSGKSSALPDGFRILERGCRARPVPDLPCFNSQDQSGTVLVEVKPTNQPHHTNPYYLEDHR